MATVRPPTKAQIRKAIVEQGKIARVTIGTFPAPIDPGPILTESHVRQALSIVDTGGVNSSAVATSVIRALLGIAINLRCRVASLEASRLLSTKPPRKKKKAE